MRRATAVPVSAGLGLRPPEDGERSALEAVWGASQDADDPTARPRGGWWSIADWATDIRVLVDSGEILGLAATRRDPGETVAEARLALAPGHRRDGLAEQLIRTANDTARRSGAALLRLYAPAGATWATGPARNLGFRRIRELHVMLRPASAGPLNAPAVADVLIRPLGEGEEPALLVALNRAWAGTWNFRPITEAALARDLAGQREGMLVAVDRGDPGRVVATCHAIFDPTGSNPGGGPYAWISNLTVDPARRGRGLARALLAAGLEHLQRCGARSVALGVDGGDIAPVTLYHSAGFAVISTLEVWERPTQDISLPSASRGQDESG